jgi:hypothetical protein
MPRLPTFLIIGTGRAGTTSLWHYLRQHPDVFMSDPKEPHFFALEGETRWRGPGADWLRANSVTTFDAYVRLFEAAGNSAAVGEASTLYLSNADCPARIHARLPGAKLIAMLRNPVDVTYAQYLGARRDGWEAASFEDAILDEPRRTRDGWVWALLRERAFYHRHLTRYLAYFPHTQVRTYLFDDFIAEPMSVVRDVFDFIGVDSSFVPDTSAVLGGTGVPDNLLLRFLWRWVGPVRHVVRPYLPQRLRDAAFTRVHRNLVKPSMRPETRSALLEGFRPDILALQDLLGRDLSHWLA